MPDKAVFVSAAALCTAFTGETAIYPKAPPSGKEWICIFIQTNHKMGGGGGGVC